MEEIRLANNIVTVPVGQRVKPSVTGWYKRMAKR